MSLNEDETEGAGGSWLGCRLISLAVVLDRLYCSNLPRHSRSRSTHLGPAQRVLWTGEYKKKEAKRRLGGEASFGRPAR